MDDRYKLAFDEAKAAIALQDSALANLRNMRSGLLATATVVSTFAGALGLIGSDPTKGNVLDKPLAVVLVVIVVGIGMCSTLILAPSRGWVFSLDAQTLVTGWIEATVPASIDDMHKGLAIYLRSHELANRGKLERRFTVYRIALALLMIETVLLIGGFTLWD